MAIVSSGGRLQRTQLAAFPHIESVGVNDYVRTFEGGVARYDQVYRSQPAVRTVVGFRARNLAQLPLQLMRQAKENDFQVVTDTPLARLLRRPTTQGSPYKFMYALVADLSIYDRTLWLKTWDNRLDRERLTRIPPTEFVVEGDHWDIDRIRLTRGSADVTVDLSQCLYIDGYRPEANYGGVPPLETLANTVAEETSAALYRGAMWKNGARMEHVITRPLEAKRMSPDAKDRFWQRWNSRYSGTLNAAKTGMLEEGMGIQKVEGYSSKDAQYVEGRLFNLEEVARLFYIPPAALGVLEGATYANMTAQQRQMYRECFGPDIEYLQQELMRQLGPEDPGDKLQLVMNLNAKVEASMEELAPALQTLTGGPVLTPNEGRRALKRPALPDGDELRTVSGTVDPAAEDDQADQTGEQPDDKPDDQQDSGQGFGTVTPVRRPNAPKPPQRTGTPSPYRQLEREA